MDHASVNSRLSAYLDGEVTPEEKVLIERHLQGCERCRNDLYELRRTVYHLRDLGEVEPPPWLTRRIMTRVGEEAERRGGRLRRLFLPLRWKLPIEAAALVFLTVTGYLVYRAVSPEVPLVVPPARETRDQASAPAPQVFGPRQPSGEIPRGKTVVPPVGEGGGGRHRIGKPSPPVAPPPPASGEESWAPVPPPSASPDAETMRSAPGTASGSTAGSVAADDSNDHGKAKSESFAERKALSPAVRSKAVAPVAVNTMRLLLTVADDRSAVHRIEAAARHFGAEIVRSGQREGMSEMVVRLDRKMLPEFLERLGGIGEVRKMSPVPAGGEGFSEVSIEVRTGPVEKDRKSFPAPSPSSRLILGFRP